MIEAQANLDALLQSLTWNNWFDMLPILSDAFREAKGWEAGEAVDWLIENRKRPTQERLIDPIRRQQIVYGWRLHGVCPEASLTITREIDELIRLQFGFHSPGSGWSNEIQPQIICFVEAWQNGENSYQFAKNSRHT